MPEPTQPIRIVRIIARLNIGGPAIQAISLTQKLHDCGYETRLVRGSEGRDEGNMDYLAEELGVRPTLVASMRRDPGPGDIVALWKLVRILRRDRPHIVHTHAAKAGTLGRLAALVAFPHRAKRPILVHTYHGHSLTGYFSSRTAAFYRLVERFLAKRTDVLVAVSEEVRDDLVRLGVAPCGQFEVIRLGFDLAPFLDDSRRAERRAALRSEWGIGADEQLVTLTARLVPIKRVDRFLRVARRLTDHKDMRFVVVGDGELRDELIASPDAQALGDRLIWAGFRRGMADVYFASDVVMLTSDNEGTPVSLIEAQAAAVPVVASDVGGVRAAVRDGETGVVVSPEDVAGFARAVASMLDDPTLGQAMAAAGRRDAAERYQLQRLVDELNHLYHVQLEKGWPGGL